MAEASSVLRTKQKKSKK